MLKGTAADALRPYTPKNMKHMAIEETKFFKRLNFGTKWNLRDLLRHKARSAMTLFGIIGCVLSALCLGRVVFSKFWNKYLSHVPEMALLTVVWFLIILALL